MKFIVNLIPNWALLIMGCCSIYKTNQLIGQTDKYTPFQANTGLSLIPLPYFYSKIKELKKCVITLSMIGSQFKTYRFGVHLLRTESSLNKTLLNHSTFKRVNGNIDYFRICILGLLYCKANFFEKCDFLVQVFDEDEDADGVIKIALLRRLVRLLVYIPVLIFPNLANGLTPDKVKRNDHKFAKQLVKMALEKLLDGDSLIHCNNIKLLISRKAPFILDPVLIRAKYEEMKMVKTGEDQDGMIFQLSRKSTRTSSGEIYIH